MSQGLTDFNENQHGRVKNSLFDLDGSQIAETTYKNSFDQISFVISFAIF